MVDDVYVEYSRVSIARDAITILRRFYSTNLGIVKSHARIKTGIFE